MARRKKAANTGPKIMYARITRSNVGVELLDSRKQVIRELDEECDDAREVIEALGMENMPDGTYRLNISIEPEVKP